MNSLSPWHNLIAFVGAVIIVAGMFLGYLPLTALGLLVIAVDMFVVRHARTGRWRITLHFNHWRRGVVGLFAKIMNQGQPLSPGAFQIPTSPASEVPDASTLPATNSDGPASHPPHR